MRWTKDLEEKLITLYEHTDNEEISKIIGASVSSIANKAFQLKLKKKINSGRFRKGQTPPNKGKKQVEYMSIESIQLSAKSRFQKGSLPHNTKEIGTINYRSDGYWWVKLDHAKWDLLHRQIYLANNPEYIFKKNEIVEFIDGDRNNCSIENLSLNTRIESAKRAIFHENNIVRRITKDKDLQKLILEKMPELIQLRRLLTIKKKQENDKRRKNRKNSPTVREEGEV